MLKRLALTGAVFFAAAPIHAENPSVSRKIANAVSSAEWTEEGSGRGLAIHSRLRIGSGLKEFKGVGVIDASPEVVFAVLDDSEAYASFMPYTSECRVLKREKDSVLAYQRLELPFITDRDYTLRSTSETWIGPEGPIHRIRWAPANDLGPAARPGVLRVNVCEGGWLLEPEEKGTTRATYSIYSDNGGALPPFLANNGGRMGIRKVFEAIRKQVKHPKYSARTAEMAQTSGR